MKENERERERARARAHACDREGERERERARVVERVRWKCWAKRILLRQRIYFLREYRALLGD